MDKIIETIDQLKSKIDSLRPLNPLALEKLAEALKYEMIYNSNAIEGNTLTLNETMLVIETGITIEGKSWKEHVEAANLSIASDLVAEMVREQIRLNSVVTRQVHQAVLATIGERNAGVYRDTEVIISGSTHKPTSPENISLEMDNLFDAFEHMWNVAHPVDLASWFHLELVRIHPFIDGNGRTARLLMNMILMQKGYPAIVLFADPARRAAYMQAIEQAIVGKRDKEFKHLIRQRVKETLELYVNALTPIHIKKLNTPNTLED